MKVSSYAWRRVGGGEGHASALVRDLGDRWRFAAAEVLVARRRPVACRFVVELDREWRDDPGRGGGGRVAD